VHNWLREPQFRVYSQVQPPGLQTAACRDITQQQADIGWAASRQCAGTLRCGLASLPLGRTMALKTKQTRKFNGFRALSPAE
jgi:hypothetical protein